jgi:hypothetical protein
MILTVAWDYLLIPFLLLYTFLYMKYKIQQYNRKNRRKRRLPKIPKLPY